MLLAVYYSEDTWVRVDDDEILASGECGELAQDTPKTVSHRRSLCRHKQDYPSSWSEKVG